MRNNQMNDKEEEQSSLSLHQDTFIQQYGGLSSSSQSSNGDEVNHEEMQKDMPNKEMFEQPRQKRKSNNKKNQYKNRQINPLVYFKKLQDYNMNDEGESPSTKQQTYINIQNRNNDNNNNWQPSSGIIKEYPNQEDNQDVQEAINNKKFNIQSFLNAQPKQRKNKQRNNTAMPKRLPLERIKYSVRQKKCNEQIALVTLDEQLYADVGPKQQQPDIDWRYNEIKLNFLDNFMPQSCKIKNNPYQLLKHIQHKNKYNKFSF